MGLGRVITADEADAMIEDVEGQIDTITNEELTQLSDEITQVENELNDTQSDLDSVENAVNFRVRLVEAGGNTAVAVPEYDSLSDSEMQSLANETNSNEIAMVVIDGEAGVITEG